MVKMWLLIWESNPTSVYCRLWGGRNAGWKGTSRDHQTNAFLWEVLPREEKSGLPIDVSFQCRGFPPFSYHVF